MHTYHDIIYCCMTDMIQQMYSKISLGCNAWPRPVNSKGQINFL